MSKFPTRVVELAEPRARSAAKNSRTIVASYRNADLEIDFRGLFVAHYDRIRATCMELAAPGLAVFAIDRWSGWKGNMYLASRPGEVRAGVVGRHSSADLFLGHDPTIALRHLLFVVEPPCSLPHAFRGEVRFRMLDLQTGSPPTDEEGRAVASLTAEGPVFLACQDHAIMAFVTGDPTDWPESADDAWDCIPERVFVEERLAPTAAGSGPSPLPGGAASRRAPADISRVTIVRHHDGLVHVGSRNAGEDGVVYGKLMILTGEKSDRFAVTREALRRGLLVGRYERCEASGRHGIHDEGVSRVHLVVVEIAGRPFAIDVASSNGTFRLCEESSTLEQFLTTHLEDGALLCLGGRDTAVGWNSVATVAEDVRHAAPAPVAERGT